MSDPAADKAKALDASNVALGFKNFSVATENPMSTLVYNVSGYVQKGGVTAVMGASASGNPSVYICMWSIYIFPALSKSDTNINILVLPM
jgi:ABC-type uncharacterized transport system YnjBCD ATPase subunit